MKPVFPSELAVKKLDPNAVLPTRAHPDDAGMDLYSFEDGYILPGEKKMVSTKIAMALPSGFVGKIEDRSSMAKKGFKVAGGIIDAAYRGEILIVLWNISKEVLEFKKGERVAQMLILPVATPAIIESSDLGETDRGDKGFGSSGK